MTKKIDTMENLKNNSHAFHGRKRSGRQKKYYSVKNAGEYIGKLEHECEIFGLTKGQFSLFDIIEYCLGTTGPAAVYISTWTAAGADTQRAKDFLLHGYIKKMRWLVDRSFLSRQPDYCSILINEFGDSIRTLRNHSKFILIFNESWNFVIRTSMNLNSNPRMESFEISEDSEFLFFLKNYVDEIFEKVPAVDNFLSKSVNSVPNRVDRQALPVASEPVVDLFNEFGISEDILSDSDLQNCFDDLDLESCF
jgi:hypothetical protein